MEIIGTCGSCGGMVTLPDYWHGIKPPVPRCTQCGRTKKNPYGPRIEMEGEKYD